MPAHVRDVIRESLRANPEIVVRFVDALTIDTHFLRDADHVLFVNPYHRAFVESIRPSAI